MAGRRFALLTAANLSGAVDRGAAVHALAAGAMGTMMLAMMSRAALGHSGRKVTASPAMVAAYAVASPCMDFVRRGSCLSISS